LKLYWGACRQKEKGWVTNRQGSFLETSYQCGYFLRNSQITARFGHHFVYPPTTDPRFSEVQLPRKPPWKGGPFCRIWGIPGLNFDTSQLGHLQRQSR